MIRSPLTTSISFHGASLITARSRTGQSRAWLDISVSDGSLHHEITFYGNPDDEIKFAKIAQAINQAQHEASNTVPKGGPRE